ncbi:GNAT family N-acetyltransferase [Paucidesulfovibrio longus]|uniref:GNAT family N-acetyltransferase n=1 Tax=Paucidesulfovibrio longus TaxID=889 RepID=UPI0003B46C68|nr:GNAT family N-acetyltransferase [Paucidesulfovibrio longus]
MSVLIRRVREGDWRGCCAVEAACFPPDEAAEPDSVAERIRVFPQGFYVAEDISGTDSVIAGMINSGATSRNDITDEAFKKLVGHDPDGRNMVVFSLSVRPEWQGQGIARQLMERFVLESRTQGKACVLLLCKDFHIGFYEKLGFAHCGLSASTHGGAAWHEMRMRL